MKRTIRRSIEKEAYFLNEAFYEFKLEKQSLNLAENTIINYETSYLYLLKLLNLTGKEETSILSLQTIQDFINALKKKGNKPSSINHYLRDIRTFFYWCMDKERQYIDPPFSIQMIKEQEESFKLFSKEDIEKLLVEPKMKKSGDDFVEWRTWAIVNYVLATGDRASSICSIRMENVDLQNGQITLPHTKNKKVHITVISPTLDNVLRRYLKLFWGKRKRLPKEFLFPNIDNGQMTPNALRLSFSRYCKERDVSRTSIHGLRHTFATNWAITDGNPLKLQSVLGHSTLTMTRKYIEMSVNDLKEDYEEHSLLDQINKGKRRTKRIGKQDQDSLYSYCP